MTENFPQLRCRPGTGVPRRPGSVVTAAVLDGKAIAAENPGCDPRAGRRADRPRALPTVLVGDDPASAVYVHTKRPRCVRLYHRSPAWVRLCGRQQARAGLEARCVGRQIRTVVVWGTVR